MICFENFNWNCFSKKSLRLPDHIRPIEYELLIHPNLGLDKDNNFEGDFNGTVKIRLSVTKPTKEIKLHSNKLWIDEANIKLSAPSGELSIFVSIFKFYWQKLFKCIHKFNKILFKATDLQATEELLLIILNDQIQDILFYTTLYYFILLYY